MNRVVANRVCELHSLVLSLLVSAGAAQKPPTSRKTAPVTADKLIALKVTRTTRYTDKEILAASGLQIGQNAADGDFKEAVRRLGDTGLFSRRRLFVFLFRRGVKLDLQLTDIDKSKLVPAHFENFVWFTDARTANGRTTPRAAVQAVAAACRQSSRPGFRGAASHSHRETFPGRVDFLRVGDESGGALHASIITSRKSASEFATSNSRELHPSKRLCSQPQAPPTGAEYGALRAAQRQI
jgi:hypothetical protein